MDNTSKKAIGLNSNVRNVNPSEIRFSQTSVNGSEEIIASMKSNGWKGDPIDFIRMPDGNLTTIDNTRVAASREAGIEVQVTIRNYSDPLPADMVGRFTTPKGVPKTWGESLDLRIQKQKASFRNNNPMGSYDLEKMK
ncbi:ParB/RepB/Spo0J family partition protein [Bacillus pseudomycoides]|nr:ParB/RepB/Spo0J family partition protein [Bacillus pseudomycoides]MED1599181.1 ParB/RepB/Spo0J family partition protein [Bacillus pseudomycoides]MED4713878.1 ParB/RepB/Spo0J family partition protein [Bacillus pseudomycoides]